MPRYSTIRIHQVIKVLGLLVLIEGLFMLTSLIFSYLYQENDFFAILISSLVTIFVGFLMWLYGNKNKVTGINKREGYIIVTFTWVITSFFGALPFYIHGAIPNYTDAFFETMSGFTTTGASILTDIESVPKGLLFWRSLTHWIGGMGIIVLSLAILPLLGIGGMQLFTAEVPGPTPDKLHPRIKETAQRLWGIYVLFTIIETGLLMLGDMSLFDALCHAFGTMATGGFSTQNDSIASYSPYIQYVIIVFMFLAGTNFTLHYWLLRRNIKKIWANEEFRFYFYIFIFFTLVVSSTLIAINNKPMEPAFRGAAFQIIAIVTTTGFVTENYLAWGPFLTFLIFLLMFVGGSAGSTGGGVKVTRQVILFKNSLLELKRLVHPMAIIPVRFNKKPVSLDVVYNILAFFLIYMMIFGFGALVLTAMGLDFETSIGASASTLGNIGPGIGDVGPVENYASIPVAGKWFLSFLMLLGRLELFTVLMVFSPVFWKR